MPMPDQAPAAEEEAAEPAQDQAAEAAAEEKKDYKALYEEALAQSRFDYESARHRSKTPWACPSRAARFDYQSVRHCSKTVQTSLECSVGLITSQFDTAPKLVTTLPDVEEV